MKDSLLVRTVKSLWLWRREVSLARYTVVILAALVLFATWLSLSGGSVSSDALPIGDGEHYTLRALTLYGFAHTGQWGLFWNELVTPNECLFPVHYLLFMLVPPQLASVALYGVLQSFVSFALLALGLFSLCRELQRPSWSPALFLFCSMQNVTLSQIYFYYADTPFLAVISLSLAAQLRAWRRLDDSSSLLSGMGAAFPLWVKPANALVYLGTYLLAEFIRFLFWPRVLERAEGQGMSHPYPERRQAGFLLFGFAPIAAIALFCGGFQSIVYLVDANQVSGLFTTHLQNEGIFRLFYFPFCLSFFYHLGLLIVLATLVALVARTVKTYATAPRALFAAPFSVSLLLPLLGAYSCLGFFFSFGMDDKEMRSLLMVLPVFWLGIFWVLEKWRVEPSLVFLLAVLYTGGAAIQVRNGAFGLIDSRLLNSGDYQLDESSLVRFPYPHSVDPRLAEMTRRVLGLMGQILPHGGKVAIGTEQRYLTSESLDWMLESQTALTGAAPPYDFNNFLTNQGAYSRPALLGSRAILLILHPNLQYSKKVEAASFQLAHFAYTQWFQQERSAWVYNVMVNDSLLGVLIVPDKPLDDRMIDQALAATGATELQGTTTFGGSRPKPLSLSQWWNLFLHHAAANQ